MRALSLGRHSGWFIGVFGAAAIAVLLPGCKAPKPKKPPSPRAGVEAAGETIRAGSRGPDRGVEGVDPSALAAPSASDAAGPCCAPQGAPGCDDPIVAACVCAEDPSCCDGDGGEWDGLCVLEVDALGCGACGRSGSCCDAHGEPGCVETAVSECVCAHDPYCCAGAWDELCALEVGRLGCGSCDAGGRDEPCCLPHGSAGCVDPEVARCVCEQNPYCCEESWDEACVAAVDSLGCGACEGDDGCCSAHDGPGCDAPAVESCVCDVAPGCCSGAWDETCVGLVELLGCGACEPPPPAACCLAHEAAGCDEVVVESCVCAEHPECCAGPWTDACAAAVTALGCGICDDERGCCLAHETGGCDGADVEACVCAGDPYCCSASWDDACVAAVESFGCGSCEDEAPLCGEGPGVGCEV